MLQYMGETYTVESFIDVTMYYSKLDAWKEKCQRLKVENENLKVDKVTSLPNRLELDKYIEQLNNNGQYKIFVMCDIDYFKRINDNYGHQVGDLVLNRFGSIFKNNVRQEDFVGRYGGEEFLFVFNAEDLELVLRRLHYMRQAIKSDQELSDKGLNSITFSAGISICSSKLNPTEAIDNADKALYQVKKNGKNGEAVFDRKSETSYMVKRGIIDL